MTKKDYVPSNVLDFQVLVRDVRAQVKLNRVRWDISDTAAEVINKPADDYDAVLLISENPETRTSAVILRRDEVREALESVFRPFVQGHLIHNPLVTPDDLRAMGLPVHDLHPTPPPDPTEAPVMSFSQPSPGVIEVGFGTKVGRAKPEGVAGCEICSKITDSPTPPTDWEELEHAEYVTRSPKRYTFSGKERSLWFHFAGRFINTRGVKGPWCEIISVVIP
ncbi:MAG: hypothetical protein LBK07_07395 [Tannerella sp.]|jgi:hypothetical protein|nr:hypothetical protein [Tannerella sp.]